MDNVTPSLTALMPARAGLGRLTPRAGLLVMLAANTRAAAARVLQATSDNG